MRQAHSSPPRYARAPARPTWGRGWPVEDRAPRPEPFNPVIAVIVATVSAAWFLLTLPFRLVFGAISLLGRLTGVAVGFALMAVGMAFCAGPFYLIGVPMFLIGLLLTLRCLG
jgi:hypothetical protein